MGKRTLWKSSLLRKPVVVLLNERLHQASFLHGSEHAVGAKILKVRDAKE